MPLSARNHLYEDRGRFLAKETPASAQSAGNALARSPRFAGFKRDRTAKLDRRAQEFDSDNRDGRTPDRLERPRTVSFQDG